MVAEKLPVERHGQWIVDLETHDLFDAVPSKPVEPTGFGERGEHATMAVGGHCHVVRGVEQQPSAGGIDGREIVLPKHVHAFR